MKKILLIIGFVAIAGIILFTASFFTKKPAGKIGNKVDQAIEKIKDEGETSLKNAGKKAEDLERVYLAGGFARHIDLANAVASGLLPDIPLDRYRFIGNGSLLGARLTSFSTDILDDARRVAGMMTNIELSENTDFMDNYIAALFLPHTNTEEFPMVSKRLARRSNNNLKEGAKV